ncbi:MAG: TonB family protein [Opitutaceae bacterium]|nr:TonB family protein [Opitutaceae bacterium]
MSGISGTLSNGRFLRVEPVTVEFTPDGRVQLQTAESRLEFPLTEVRISDRIGSIPRFLYLPGSLVVETLENDAIDAALLHQRRGRISRLIHNLETHSSLAAAATVCLVLVAVLSLYYGLPALAEHVAFKTPASVEREAGRLAFATLTQNLAPSQLNRAQRDRVRAQLVRLLPDRPADQLPRLEYRTFYGAFPNVFALPGGIILVSDEFVRLTSHDDEIAAVLAHEIGHLERRHGVQTLLRQSFALLLVTSLTGDLSTLTQFSAALPLFILRNGYSREFEREADRYARDLLLDRKIPLHRFSSILRKLTATRPKTGFDTTYLSTHPSTEERLKLFPSPPGIPEPPTPIPARPTPLPRNTGSRGSIPTPTPQPSALRPLVTFAVDRRPSIQHQVNPVYPAYLKNSGARGTIELSVVVNPIGEVIDSHVIRTDHPALAQPAQAAVLQWKFRPAERNGKAVTSAVTVKMRFDPTSAEVTSIHD